MHSMSHSRLLFVLYGGMLLLPEGHKDGVPFLMDDNLLRHNGLGASLFLDQVVFAHKHPVVELGAGGEIRLLRPTQTEDLLCSSTIS